MSPLYKARLLFQQSILYTGFHSLRNVLPSNMRYFTVVALVLTMTLALFLRCCEGAGLRVALPDDDEDFRPRPLYRDYIRSRAARADDAFDDYGHLRFGRSED